MERTNTKKRIIKKALSLFANKGYDAVSIAQIAEAVGIKGPSLYKHFKSKQDIFEAILKEMADRYEKQMGSMQLSGTIPDQDAPFYMKMKEEQLISIGKNIFLYFLQDEYACNFRRMLAIEQYHNKELAALYAKQYLDDPITFQGAILGLLMKEGCLVMENPRIAALHFYSPIYLLLSMCDCHSEKEAEALALLEEHIKQFNRMYQKKEE